MRAGLERTVAWIGRAVSWLTLGLVLVMSAIVLLRYGFGQSSIALQESVLWMNSAVFLLGAAWSLQCEQHVKVDVFSRAWPKRRMALMNLMGTVFFLLPVCGFLIWISHDYVNASWQMREASREPGGLPALYVMKAMIPLCGLLLAAQGIAHLRRDWNIWRGRDDPSSTSTTAAEPLA